MTQWVRRLGLKKKLKYYSGNEEKVGVETIERSFYYRSVFYRSKKSTCLIFEQHVGIGYSADHELCAS